MGCIVHGVAKNQTRLSDSRFHDLTNNWILLWSSRRYFKQFFPILFVLLKPNTTPPPRSFILRQFLLPFHRMCTPSFSHPHLSAYSHHRWFWPPLASTVKKCPVFTAEAGGMLLPMLLFHYFLFSVTCISVITWFLSFQPISTVFSCYIWFNELNFFHIFGYRYICNESWFFLIPFSLFFCLLERSIYTYFNSFLISLCFNKRSACLMLTEAWEPLPAVHTCGLTKKLAITVVTWECRL